MWVPENCQTVPRRTWVDGHRDAHVSRATNLNLDAVGVELVRGIIESEVASGTSIVLATNSLEETEWCNERLRIEDFLHH